jgi:hypothetical protein
MCGIVRLTIGCCETNCKKNVAHATKTLDDMDYLVYRLHISCRCKGNRKMENIEDMRTVDIRVLVENLRLSVRLMAWSDPEMGRTVKLLAAARGELYARSLETVQ